MTTPDVKQLKRALELLSLIDTEFSIQAVICFLEIAQNEGINGKDLTLRTGISFSNVSRYLARLSDKPRYKKESYGLIELKIDPYDRRMKTAWLTPKGKKLIKQLSSH